MSCAMLITKAREAIDAALLAASREEQPAYIAQELRAAYEHVEWAERQVEEPRRVYAHQGEDGLIYERPL